MLVVEHGLLDGLQEMVVLVIDHLKSGIQTHLMTLETNSMVLSWQFTNTDIDELWQQFR